MRLSTIALIALFGWGCGSKSDDKDSAAAVPSDADGGSDVGSDVDADGTTDADDDDPPTDDSGSASADDSGTLPADDTSMAEDSAAALDTADTGEPVGPDSDGDGAPDSVDCDDSDSAVFPGADEVCDGIDNDCDGDIDEAGSVDAPTWYADTDGDGWGRESVAVLACVAPEGFVDRWGDCNDHSALALPGGTEVCDELDNDCDGTVDEGDATDATIFYVDADGDGFGDGSSPVPLCSLEDGYAVDSTDCDDTEAQKYPGATEYCDGLDNDCDGTTDEPDALDAVTWYQDGDADGYGLTAVTEVACDAPTGFAAASGDCDDVAPAINPGATEVCDAIDNDCNGTVDGAEAIDATTWYQDSDGDGYGLMTAAVVECDAPEGYVLDGTDCDDAAAAAFPGGIEVCDSLDNDCNGEVDESAAVDAPTWFNDADTDGYGDALLSVVSCVSPASHVSNDLDCDDTQAAINPDADEVCDTVDNDCDGEADESDAIDALTWYPDGDADGYGVDEGAVNACSAVPEHALATGDCDDDVAAVNPGLDEVCDGLDNDCDAEVDEPDAIDALVWYPDVDLDGYGDRDAGVSSCTAIADFINTGLDCDDGDIDINPDAEDTWYDGIDSDCSDTSDYDQDGDGYDSSDHDGADCDDLNPDINPEAEEVWYDGIDGDCSGGSDEDQDGDGHDRVEAGGDDCDDLNAAISPSADEVCDGIDNNCDVVIDEDTAVDATTWFEDADEDGYGDAASTTASCTVPVGYVAASTDCNDADAAISPGGTEICGDAIDNDCNGSVDGTDASDALTWYRDADGDGFGDAASTTPSCTLPEGYSEKSTDCDDSAASAYPGGTEVCDGLDNNCDGVVDDASAIDPPTWYIDGDGDGHGVATTTVDQCDAPTGYADNADDCDDTDAEVSPSLDEVCDGKDNDCDTEVDEDDAVDAPTWYFDGDADGYGDVTSTVVTCGASSDYVALGTDCDDSDDTINPDATEVCDGIDNDCNGTVDGADASDATPFYRDEDSDGYGLLDGMVLDCAVPDGYVVDSSDCDDSAASAYPGGTEVCDGLDNNCDGVVDDASVTDAPTWYRDLDVDGYGDAAFSTAQCDAPPLHVDNDLDCNDYDATVSPIASEMCDGVDNDCDGDVDESDAIDASIFYTDGDADGFGDDALEVLACDLPAGAAAVGGDCDDADASSTRIDTDGDCDGVLTADDCDDTDAASTVVATDADCDGVVTVDDCDDTDSSLTAVATDGDCDGILTADDCDDSDVASTAIAADMDCDGVLTADDCDDTDAASTVVATDADCDGILTADDCDDSDAASTVVATDGDCDGVLTADDCDDADPLSTVIADDPDCDGTLDEDPSGDGGSETGDTTDGGTGTTTEGETTADGGTGSATDGDTTDGGSGGSATDDGATTGGGTTDTGATTGSSTTDDGTGPGGSTSGGSTSAGG